jgi:mannose-P-dolichol utilization defect 1
MKRIFWVLIALSVVASVCVCVEEVEGEKNEEVEEPPRMRMFVITEECYEKLIVKKEMDGACIKKTLAKIIGYSIVILASIVKVPQIIKIMAAGSTEGIDDQSFYFEFIAYTVSLFYSVHTLQPFSAYGETAFLSFQSLILLFLLWSYNKKKYTFKMISFQLFLMSVGIYVLYKDTIVSDPLWKLLFGISNPLST